MKGKVFLVGAGPGDYELLTLKAKRLLESAETVVYDHLADERILGFAPKDAEYIYVGKEAGNHAMKQPDINQLLVDKAKEGKSVVRLKGGDPFVFGRGGEEALLLRENDLPFEVVPGVTSAIAVAAYAGIPVTHRGVAVSFAVITGHEGAGKETSDVNWEKLATAVDTLVFLMSVSNISEIADKLMQNGRDGDTPVAFIRWGTKSEQTVTVTTLKDAGETAKTTNLKPPAIFLVGEVVKLRENLKWFDYEKTRPLFGKTVLVTRARAQASALTEKLERLGAKVLELPAIKITDPKDDYAALDKAIESLSVYAWLIFTSANGVERFFARLKKAQKDSRALASAKIVAIGSATKEKLEMYGITADIVPEKYIAEGILAALEGKVNAGDKILLARAKEARETLPEGLKKLGAEVTVATAYETEACGENADAAKKMLENGEIDYITFTSSSTVDNLIAAVGKDFGGAKLVAIGPVTAETIKKHGLTPSAVADVYTLDGVVAEIIKAEKSNHK